ncbi:MAG: carbohydrate-binding family 9-like protein [Vicinamibacteraceae bacterium]
MPDPAMTLAPSGYTVARALVDHARLLGDDDEAWATAPAIAWGRAPFATRFRAQWTASTLYVRFDADDTSPWFTMGQRDASIWEEEVVEIFLDPAGQGVDYFELEISPANVVCDLRVRRPYPTLHSETSFDLDGLESAVRLHGEGQGRAPGWIATAAVPFAGLRSLPVPDAIAIPPAAGDVWRFNVFRIKRPNGPMRPKDGAILEAWSPTGTPSFHVPAAFQALTFR